MDIEKVYFDTEGNECSIWKMVIREPHWAANRIQEGEKALDEIARLRAELATLRTKYEQLREIIDDGSESMTHDGAVAEAEALRVDAEKAIIDVAIKALTQGYYSGRIVTGAGVTSLSARQWAADFAESTPLFKNWIDAAIDAARGGK